MSALILDRSHWRAAQERRACRKRAMERALHAGMPLRQRRSLDEILGPAFDPTGGAA
jgi:hypothetical protein